MATAAACGLSWSGHNKRLICQQDLTLAAAAAVTKALNKMNSINLDDDDDDEDMMRVREASSRQLGDGGGANETKIVVVIVALFQFI